MVLHNLKRSFCLMSFFVAISNMVKIEKLIVPEVTQVGNASYAILECYYSDVSDDFIVQWLFNDYESPVYQSGPHNGTIVTNGLMEGHIDSKFTGVSTKRATLRLVALQPELSGEYTCRVLDHAAEARQTNTMLVFSPEKEFQLEYIRKDNSFEIKCIARGLYPLPELTLEQNGVAFTKQQQHILRNDRLYEADSIAHLNITSFGHFKPVPITCRLQLPQAGYIAIKKEVLGVGIDCNNKASTMAVSTMCISISILINK